jgi:spermidine/putrescine-binding protein
MKRLIGLVVILALVGAACGESEADVQALADACEAGEVDGDLNLYNWTAYLPTGPDAEDAEVTDFITEFETRYPDVNVVYTQYDSNEAMLAQVDAGASYDLVVPSDYMVSIMKGSDLLVKLNHDAIANLGNLDPLFADPGYDRGNEYSVPYQWGTTGIGFNYDYIDDSEGVSWAVIFEPDADADYLGRISFLNDTRETLGAALKYLGYSINTKNPDELAEAEELIRNAKANIAAFDSSSYWTLLTNGDTHVAMGWNGDFLAEYDGISTDEFDAYEQFGYAIPTEGAAAWVDTMAIPTTAEHPCTAHAFIDMVLEPFMGGELTNYNYYASPNKAAEEHIYEEILTWEAVYPSPETMANLEFFEDLGDFEIEYADAFARAKS